MAKIEARRVLGAKNCSGLTNPEAVAQLGDELSEGFHRGTLPQLLAAEQREKDQAEGYEIKPGKVVSRRTLREAWKCQGG